MNSSSISVSQALIPFVPNKIQELVTLSPESEKKASLATRICAWAASACTKIFSHLPSGIRTAPSRYVPVKIEKKFFESKIGQEIGKIVDLLHEGHFFTGTKEVTKKRLEELLLSESTSTGEVMAELIYARGRRVSEVAEKSLISYLAAFEKLRRCGEHELREVDCKSRAAQESIERFLENKHRSFTLQINDLKGRANADKIHTLALHLKEIAEACEQKAAALEKENSDKARIHEGYQKLCAAITQYESDSFPESLQVQLEKYERISKENIRTIESFIGHDEPLYFRFLVMNKNGVATSSVSAYVEESRSFIFMPQKGKFWFYKKSACYDEIQKILSARCGRDDIVEMTVWKEGLPKPSTASSSCVRSESPRIIEIPSSSHQASAEVSLVPVPLVPTVTHE